ncbi:MAG: hypothetical protein JXB88_17100 [Spirochaetales bacterium]|nr:hypothetical protein [Spirochaetales bacterium]
MKMINNFSPQRSRQLFLCIVFIICIIIPCYSLNLNGLSGKIPFPGKWRIKFDDKDIYSEREFDDKSWFQTSLPYMPDKEMPEGTQFIWLRNTFTVEGINPGKKTFLLLGRLEGAIEFYCNNVLIGFHGSFPPEFQHRNTSLKQILFPTRLLRLNEENVLSIRIYHPTGRFHIPQFYFADYNTYLFNSQFLDFLNVKLYLVYSMVCLLLGFYYIFQFAFRQKERPNLYFALSNFCFCIYFLNMGLEVHFFPFYFAESFSQSFLPLFFGFLVLFFLNFFNIHNNKWFKRIIFGLSLILCFLFYLNIGQKAVIPGLFNYVLIPSALELTFMVYISIRATIEKRKFALPIMIGTILGFIFAIHDIYYQMTEIRPFIWLQGTGIFCFNMSMFIALAFKSIRAYNDLETYSDDIVRKSKELEMYIRNITEVTETVSCISAQLEENILSTSGSIEKMASGSINISDGVNNQFHIVQKTNETVLYLLNSLEDIYMGLNTQFEQVQETSATIEEMIQNIGEITKNLKYTSEFAEDLKIITRQGEEIVLSSAKSVQEIITVSEDAYKIIDTVSDLSEQTNVLAINAAIEAAHAGKYGTGFAVVAGEIKRLATGSSNRSTEILSRIREIINKIEQGVHTNNKVKEVFEAIHNKTGSAVHQIQSIYSAILEQKIASEQVLYSISQLNDSSQKIKIQAEKQESGGKIIRGNIEKLVSSSQTVLDNITTISKEIEEIVKSTNSVKTIGGESMKLILKLNDILKNHSKT